MRTSEDEGVRLSRRAFVRGAVALGAVAAIPALAPSSPLRESSALPLVVPFPSPDRLLFGENEQVFAQYLMSVVPMSNDIIDYGDDFGFMGGGWWRPEGTHDPRNSRMMEHVSTLSWFYANERSWNRRGFELYRDPALLARLEASVRYYTEMQFEDGTYPEYGGESSLAATAFGLVAQSDTYEMLRTSGAARVSCSRLERSIKRAAVWFMNTDAAHWQPPIGYFNQVAAGLVGAQRALQVLDFMPIDQAMISERISFLCDHGVADAGFPHEPFGVDYGYNFTVAMPDLAWLYLQTRHPALVSLVKNYTEFMRYAVIPEPRGAELSHVPALHNRNTVSGLRRPADDLGDRAALAKVFLTEVPDLALFLPTREEKNAARDAFRSAAGPIQPLAKPHTSPRTWMYGSIAPKGPYASHRKAVEAALPLLTNQRFTRLEQGSEGDSYLFVRRPAYYMVGVFGHRPPGLSTRQLGTLWSPAIGTVLTSTNDPGLAEGWDTLGPERAFSTRRSSSRSLYFDGRTSHARGIDSADVSRVGGLFMHRTVSDAAGYATAWRHWDRGLGFTFFTDRVGECTHSLPLLLKEGDTVTFSDGSVFDEGATSGVALARSLVLERDGHRVLFAYGNESLPTRIERSPARIAGGSIHRVSIIFERQLDIQIIFLGRRDESGVTAEAHASNAGEVSVRVVLDERVVDASTRVRVIGTGVTSDIRVGDSGSGFGIVERTFAPPEVPQTISVEVYRGDGRRVSRFSASVGRTLEAPGSPP
ncbi:hypothetical protein [Microbacterium oleivorans]|uniref:Uncharacterized protein n=1 Tax=Microbacterium oleivorans TaxID=273677 RepID=A0A7D5EW05_9MICO|nr:hypothetical protein [Microbacterium oleivorans]QLD12272.1 hypothetical protein HW566_11100 [Microbacterium oleivorans]